MRRKRIPVSVAVRVAVSVRQNRLCFRCHELRALTMHHQVPVRKGGTNHEGNLIGLCRPCHDIVDRMVPVKAPIDDGRVRSQTEYFNCSLCGDVTRVGDLATKTCRWCVRKVKSLRARSLGIRTSAR